MKVLKFIIFGTAILSAAVCLLLYFVPQIIGKLFFNEASAIGIIGGADGPTAIFMKKRNEK